MRESVIETLAENLNDSVVAPIFWFVLLGLPGAAVYRFANTADAMWGYRGTYRGQHWEWAGKWAARADDALSWLPARLTAGLLMGVTRQVRFGALRREAARTPSPNSGWPMAAMAMALGVSLGQAGCLHAERHRARAAGRRRAAGAKKCIKSGVCACPVCADSYCFSSMDDVMMNAFPPQGARIHGGPDRHGAALHDFSTNSNACAPCPAALQAVRQADASQYPDASYTALRGQLAGFHGVDAARVVLAGSASEFIFRITALAAQTAHAQPQARAARCGCRRTATATMRKPPARTG